MVPIGAGRSEQDGRADGRDAAGVAGAARRRVSRRLPEEGAAPASGEHPQVEDLHAAVGDPAGDVLAAGEAREAGGAGRVLGDVPLADASAPRRAEGVPEAHAAAR